MEPLLLLFPLLSALIPLLLGSFLGSRWSSIITTTLIGSSFLVAVSTIPTIFNHGVVYFPLFRWFSISLLEFGWAIQLDSLTVVMLLVVLSISFLVHLYSISYMAEDPHQPRFFAYLSLFTFFMILLVTSSAFPQLFVGWEGVGVCSYLLISFWFTRRQASKSALKAMVVNRFGDLGLIGAMVLLYHETGTLDFSALFLISHSLLETKVLLLGWEQPLLVVVGFLLLLGAVGKSAQLGLHTWLPDAMEGPTPVSALIHAATMVTAGVFLLIRCSPLIELAPPVLSFAALIGGLTALFGATTGLFQNDLKRVVAYSTCSQLGYMVFVCGLSSYNVAAFHLCNHAFFKALLFLGSGAIIHAYSDEQDMRRMGGLVRLLPFTYSVMLIGSLSLGGVPFLTGFYSKDLILEVCATSSSVYAPFVYGLGVVSAFFTAFYSIRLLYLTFLSGSRGFKPVYKIVGEREAPIIMLCVLVPLAILSIFIGFFSREFFVGLGTDFFSSSVLQLPTHLSQDSSEFLPLSIKSLPLIFAFGGGTLSFLLHFFFFRAVLAFQLGKLGFFFYRLLNGRWFIDPIQNSLVAFPSLRFGYNVAFKLIDRGAIEIFGPTGLYKLFDRLALSYTKLHSGYIYHYVFFTVAATAFLFFPLFGFEFRPLLIILLLCVTSLFK